MTPSEVLAAGNVPDGTFGMVEMEEAARELVFLCAASPLGWNTDFSNNSGSFTWRTKRIGFLELLHRGWLDKSFAMSVGRHAYNGQFGLSGDAVQRIVAAVQGLKGDGESR